MRHPWQVKLMVTVAAAAGMVLAARLACAAQPPAGSAELAEQLQKSLGATIHVELKSGATFVRAKLLRLAFDRKNGMIRTLSLEDYDTGKPTTIGFASVKKIVLDRETIYTAAADRPPRTAAERRARQQAERASEQRQAWVERAARRGVKPWPELTREQHQQAIDEHRKLIDEVSRAMPGMALRETHEFLFLSNIPANQIAPYTAALDAMHDMMCQMYGIPRGEAVWKGKCLVVAFLDKPQFVRFEETFMNNSAPTSAYGLCHSLGDGRVIISCYRGDRQAEFAHMLVHETSHGFIHRYRTAARLPSWVNEGMADWIGRALVPQSRAVNLRERRALQIMRQSRSMGGDFLTRKGNIEPWQYGIASSLTDFLIRYDKAAYTRFVQGIKEGLEWPESLAEAYNAKPEQLIAAYGQAIGIADLRP